MKNIRQKFKIVSILLIISMGISFFLNFSHINDSVAKDFTLEQDTLDLKTSGTYDNITIDALRWNNWTWAETQEWCTGQGTLEDPYIIQGHTIGVENFRDGIKVNNSKGVYFIIQDCTVFWDGFISTGLEMGISILNSTNGMIVNNTVYGIGSGIRIVQSENINIMDCIVYNAMAGIYFTLSDFCTIEGTTVYSTDNGIFITYSENNTLKNNIAYSNEYGVYLTYSYYNEIIGNTLDNNNNGGIKLSYSNFNNVTDNDSRGCNDGIHIEDECNNNRVINNDFSNNDYGIEMYESDFNYIAENVVNNNEYYGIRLEICENNSVTLNILRNNTQYGMYVEMGSYNNSFSENFFLQNGGHAFDEGLDNAWNSTTIGNYWDNHTGPDVSPQDEIVDIPYTYIAGIPGSIDYLPIAEDGAPSITFQSPSAGRRYGSKSPTLQMVVFDNTLVEMWYTLDGGLNNYTFKYVLLHYYSYTAFVGVVDQSAWDALQEGSVTITFFARDVAGNMAYEQVTVVKELPGEGMDPGMITLIVVISVVGGLAIVGTAYFYLRKRRGLS